MAPASPGLAPADVTTTGPDPAGAGPHDAAPTPGGGYQSIRWTLVMAALAVDVSIVRAVDRNLAIADQSGRPIDLHHVSSNVGIVVAAIAAMLLFAAAVRVPGRPARLRVHAALAGRRRPRHRRRRGQGPAARPHPLPRRAARRLLRADGHGAGARHARRRPAVVRRQPHAGPRRADGADARVDPHHAREPRAWRSPSRPSRSPRRTPRRRSATCCWPGATGPCPRRPASASRGCCCSGSCCRRAASSSAASSGGVRRRGPLRPARALRRRGRGRAAGRAVPGAGHVGRGGASSCCCRCSCSGSRCGRSRSSWRRDPPDQPSGAAFLAVAALPLLALAGALANALVDALFLFGPGTDYLLRGLLPAGALLLAVVLLAWTTPRVRASVPELDAWWAAVAACSGGGRAGRARLVAGRAPAGGPHRARRDRRLHRADPRPDAHVGPDRRAHRGLGAGGRRAARPADGRPRRRHARRDRHLRRRRALARALPAAAVRARRPARRRSAPACT